MAERGAASIVVLAGALALCSSALAAADLGAMLLGRARAQAAADAAALAAAVRQAPVLGQGDDPEAAARAAAAENGATLVRCECAVGQTHAQVEVETEVRLAFLRAWAGRRPRASARAEVDEDVFSYRE